MIHSHQIHSLGNYTYSTGSCHKFPMTTEGKVSTILRVNISFYQIHVSNSFPVKYFLSRFHSNYIDDHLRLEKFDELLSQSINIFAIDYKHL